VFSGWNERGGEPREILAALNKLLFPILPKHLYAAGLVLIIDAMTYECKLANGGIPHPYLLNSQNSTVKPIAANGLLLGIADESTFVPGDELMFRLQPGDKLLLYTDGLSEVEGKDNLRFDSQMLESLQTLTQRPMSEIMERLKMRAKAYSKKGHHWDDVTMLGIEVASD